MAVTVRGHNTLTGAELMAFTVRGHNTLLAQS
jgi:hypothetical protein